MKRSIWIFFAAVLLPSILLGWLALRSAGEQQIILERRTAELYQKETEAVATAARTLVDDERRAFTEGVRQLIAAEGAGPVADNFPVKLGSVWTRKAIGFAIGAGGSIVSPSTQDARENATWREFLLQNAAFLTGAKPAWVYSLSAEELNRPEQMRRAKAASESKLPQSRSASKPEAAAKVAPAPRMKDEARAATQDAAPAPPAAAEMDAPAPAEPKAQARNVIPERVLEETAPMVSQAVPANQDFRALTFNKPEGVITRYTQNRLEILFWMRPTQAPEMIFGCLLTADALNDLWPTALGQSGGGADFIVAILNDMAEPVATQPVGASTREWKRPFAASEIGEALPHWEAALYLRDPQQLLKNARRVRHTLILAIGAALVAIAFGGWVVVNDARRQLALAQKKSDFVSNVSHELKTPLTSIRMFAELMQNENASAEKRPQYLRIIMAEAERLTRLINNVLDFARLERKQKRYDLRPLDLHGVLERTWEGQELHLRENGFTATWQAGPPPYRIVGDEDALAQVIVNLLSNAEKYSTERKEVSLHSYTLNGSVFVSVLDRGSGVPAGEESKIFEAFYRAHDSLSSGIQGSGLGLTLAARIAAEHRGEITYQPREGGGSNFTLRLPLASDSQQ